MSNILAVVESFNDDFKKSALEAVSYAKAIASNNSGTCIVVVFGSSNKAGTLGVYGADRVLQINSNIPASDNQSMTKIISDIALSENAGMIILPNNSTAKGIVGRLSIRLKSGCVTGVQSLPEKDGADNNSIVVIRSVYAGKATAKVKVTGPCIILSLASSAIALNTTGNEVHVENWDASTTNSNIKLIETKRITGHTPLPEAELVVSAGRGMKDPSNWNIIEDLAMALGATTACSRPVADSHWRPHYEHVGQTGIAIKPKLYIAIGISGAIQHLAGVNNSKVIVVINKDPEAPFFKAADYGVCADLFEVIPKLTESVKKFKHSNA